MLPGTAGPSPATASAESGLAPGPRYGIRAGSGRPQGFVNRFIQVGLTPFGDVQSGRPLRTIAGLRRQTGALSRRSGLTRHRPKHAIRYSLAPTRPRGERSRRSDCPGCQPAAGEAAGACPPAPRSGGARALDPRLSLRPYLRDAIPSDDRIRGLSQPGPFTAARRAAGSHRCRSPRCGCAGDPGEGGRRPRIESRRCLARLKTAFAWLPVRLG